MKNTLVDLQNHLFEMIELLNDDELDKLGRITDEEFKRKIRRADAIKELALVAVQNGALMIKAADTLYGLPIHNDVPLIPQSPADEPVIVDRSRKELLGIPKAGKAGKK